jgi:gluconolactonase
MHRAYPAPIRTHMPDVSVLVEGLASPEGPDFLPDGRIVFVETFRCQVTAWSAERGAHPLADVGGAPNACLVGVDGVYVTQHGTSAGPWRSPRPTIASIQKITRDGRVEIAVSSADGRPLLGPNDFAFGPEGQLYFTDPGRFDPDDAEPGRICVAYPGGTARVLEEVGPVYPNGIAVEPDGSIVWTESFTRRVRRRRTDGSTELVATLPEDRIPDGLKLARNGRMYVAGVRSGGIDVIAPGGELVDFIPTGGAPLNCVFGGSDLYVADYGDAGPDSDDGSATTCGRLLRIPLEVEGQPLHRGWIPSAERREGR